MLKYYHTNIYPLTFRQICLHSNYQFEPMKKFLILSSVIAISLITNIASAKAFENSEPKAITTDPQTQQKTELKEKKKPTKYDFSLFKFIAPSKIQEKDSTDKKTSSPNPIKKEETVYENPRDFFRFSYAS